MSQDGTFSIGGMRFSFDAIEELIAGFPASEESAEWVRLKIWRDENEKTLKIKRDFGVQEEKVDG